MELDRGKDSRRKKYSFKEKDKEPAKKMVILMKSKEVKNEEPSPPTIILKTRDSERAVSPQFPTTSKASKPPEPSPSYQIASRSSQPPPGPAVVTMPLMKNSIKILDEDTLTMNDNLLEFLGECTDFLVVGCIGLQGVGKSTLMSHLANPRSIDDPELMPFKVQTKNHVDSGSHCTDGIHCFVTDKRVILLDAQPVLSFSIFSKYCANDGANLAINTCHRDDPDCPCVDNDVEILYLQYIAFILSVCHIVLVAQDFCFDPVLVQYLQTADVLKPPSFVQSDEDQHEHSPHCIFVHNKCSQLYFSQTTVKSMQDAYSSLFSESQLLTRSGLGMISDNFVPSLCPDITVNEAVNLFLIPEKKPSGKEESYQLRSYEEIMELLQSHIHGAQMMLQRQSTLTEKNWFHFAMKIWEDIKKSSLFVDYGRMLPNFAAFKLDEQHPSPNH